MRIKYIVCSGPNESTDFLKLLDLCEQYPLAEIAIQVSQKKTNMYSPRYDWIMGFARYCSMMQIRPNIALHVNTSWAEKFCQGTMPDELRDLMDLNMGNFVQRVQLNIHVGKSIIPEPDIVAEMINRFPKQRFILPYNLHNSLLVHVLYRKGVVFDCLYDESFGQGIVPEERSIPLYADVLQGYAGGLTHYNVCVELDKIKDAVKRFGKDVDVFIDAHKGLEDDHKNFSLEKCRMYLENAMSWLQEQEG